MRRSTSRSSQADRRTGGQTLWFALLVLSASPPIRLSAQELANSAGALFLLFPVGAQAVAMGQTAATLDGRGEAAFWNPAGLATIERGELALNSASLAAGATHALTVYYPSHRFGVLGGAVYLVDYGDLDRTDSASNTIARIAPRNIEFLASYATALAGSVTLGINYKLIEFVVDCSGDCSNFPNGHGVTHALDVGGQFTVGPAGAPRGGRGVSHLAPGGARARAGRATRRQVGRGCGQPMGELRRVRDAPGHRRRLPAVAAAARRVRVRAGRTLRAERRHGRDERVDRRGPGARLPHGLRFGRPEPDLLLLPRGVLRCAA